MNLGLVNLDTSHVIAFTELLHGDPDAFGGLRVTHAWRGASRVRGTADIEAYAARLRDEFGVTLVDDLDDLVPLVDAALIEANEGSRHLAHARPFLAAGKRCWIDKPLGATVLEAREILELAREGQTAVFSASALRFLPSVRTLAAGHGSITAADVQTPAPQHWANPGLLHYGIHGVEILMALLGSDCRRVHCVRGADSEVCTGLWADGRLGTLRCRYTGPHHYVVTAERRNEGSTLHQEQLMLADIYRPLVTEVASFLTTGQSPLHEADMLATIAFIEAAALSARLGGVGVELERWV
ncbi:MAG: Gfo/Idh/MocA family oxidoreductase [Armatimonadetes bacterium]|nr:Gfo/Idh/MocA family oxidoreductase [Armatimonadota bacterium]